MNLILASSNPLDHVVSHEVFRIGGISVTNHMIMAAVAAVLMLLIFPAVFAKGRSDTPSGVRNFFEAMLSFFREEVFRPALKDHTDRLSPFLWTVFFFVLFCNVLGFVPINEILILVTGNHAGRFAEVGGTATGNIATTAALAICAALFIHLNGIWQVAKDLMAGTYGHHPSEAHPVKGAGATASGHDSQEHAVAHAEDIHVQVHPTKTNPVAAIIEAPFLYLWNFAPHLFMPKKGDSPVGWLADIPVWGLLVFLELIGAMIKPFALCMRLFANMIAGHIVLAVLAGLILLAPGILGQLGIGVPVTAMSLMIRMLELFVAFLQAYIFTFLTTLFVAAAVAPEH